VSLVFLTVKVYSYNSGMKECIKPDDLTINTDNVACLQLFERPLISKQKFYSLMLNNKMFWVIDEESFKKIVGEK
jgi:hypothetical protein